MKYTYLKHSAVVLLIIVVSVLYTRYLSITASIILSVFIISLFFFNWYVRDRFRFKNYFTHKYNIFTNRYRHQQEFDFPKDILFPKMLEVLKDSGFIIREVNEKSGDIFAITSMSWASWGENIYIRMEEDDGRTNVDFISVCMLQMYDWGKNKRNFEKFINEFENSLII